MRHSHHHDDARALPDLLLVDRDTAATRRVRRVVITGCAVNALLMLLKLSAGWFGHSDALLADGFHSLNDVAVDLIMLIFIGISYRKASARFAYGYGKFETLASLLISLLMTFIGVIIAVEGVKAVVAYAHGEVLEHPDIWTVFAILVAMCTKEFLYRYYDREGKKLESSALQAAGWHHRIDAMSSIATLIGVAGAHFLGEKFRVLDPCASLIIALLILITAVRILIPAFAELMEHSLPIGEMEKARKAVAGTPGVEQILDLKARRAGHSRIFDITVAVGPSAGVGDCAGIADEIEKRLQHAFCPHIFVTVATRPVK